MLLTFTWAPVRAEAAPDLIQIVRSAEKTLELTADAALDVSSFDNGTPVEREIVESGWYSMYAHRAYSVVDNEAEWELLWSHHNGIDHGFAPELWPERPAVDFSREMLLVVFMGSSYCSGDWQRIVSVQTRWDETLGNVTTAWMDTNRSFVLDWVFYGDTNPYQFVKVPRINGTVVFASRHVLGDAVDAAASGATVGAMFNCLPSQSLIAYRALDPGPVALVDTVPGPASTLPFLDSPFAEGV